MNNFYLSPTPFEVFCDLDGESSYLCPSRGIVRRPSPRAAWTCRACGHRPSRPPHLERMRVLTGDRSVATNRSLMVDNARVAAELAGALSGLERPSA